MGVGVDESVEKEWMRVWNVGEQEGVDESVGIGVSESCGQVERKSEQLETIKISALDSKERPWTA